LTFALDISSVNGNHHTKYLGQRSFRSKVIQTHKHTESRYVLLYLLFQIILR